MNKYIRPVYFGLIFLLVTSAKLLSQTTVTTVPDLISAINSASGNDIITLDASFTPGDATIPMPSVSVTVDAGNVIWNTGTITVTGAGTGSLVIENLKMDGNGITGRLFTNTSSNGILTLERCEFYNASEGALNVSTSGNASTIVSYTKIYDNTAVNTASAVWVGGAAALKINHSTIKDNAATGSGYQCGAIASNFHTGNLEINNTVLKNNTNKCSNSGVIGGGGGAMSLHYFKGKLVINECLFEGNKTNGEQVTVQSTYDGGAIYIFDGRDGATIDISNTTFYKNLAYDDGGAMMIQGTGNPGLTTKITNCTFYQNKAYGLDGANVSGGAIQFFKNGGGSAMSNTILGSTFVENEAGNADSQLNQKGGAISLSGSFFSASVTYNASLFVGNKVYDSNGQLNTASNNKDISNSTTTQAGTKNVINVDKGATPLHTAEDVLGKNYTFCENLSAIKAGVDDEIIKTIPVKPEGIADVTYNGSVMLPTIDQRNYQRNKDQGAVEIAWVRFNAGDGEWTGLNDNLVYEGKEYYESASGIAKHYYKITNSTGNISAPAISQLAPPSGEVFDKWVLEKDSITEWNPSDPVVDTLRVIALYVPVPNYTIKYDPNGGGGSVETFSIVNPYTILNYNDVSLNFTPPTSNHVFDGWKDGWGNPFTVGADYTFTSDTTLYAQWKDNTPPPTPSITVTYHPNGGGGTDHTIDCAADGSHTILNYTDNPLSYTPPTPKHVFEKWNTTPDGSGVSYFPGYNVLFNYDTDLYALWKEIEEPEESVEPKDPTPGIEIQDENNSFCPDNTYITIYYDMLHSEHPLEYTVIFSEEAKKVGFEDITVYTKLPDHSISFPLPVGVPQGRYQGKIVLQSDSSANIISDYLFEFELLNTVKIITQPQSASGCSEDKFSFSVEATGDELSYQWYHNGEKIPGATEKEYNNSLSKKTAGDYFVVVTGVCGAVKSDTVYAQMNTFTILMKWDDVLYVDNTDNRYVRYQWYKNGQAVTQHGAAVYYTETDGLSGTYFVRAYYADGKYDESCSMHFSSNLPKTAFKVYPNPVQRHTRVSVVLPENAESEAVIELFNMAGGQMYHTKTSITKTEIPINLAPGIYIIKTTLQSGRTISKKLIVK